MIRSVKFVSIPVNDQDKALAFYTNLMGFTIVTDQPMGTGAQRWIELKIPGADTGVVLFTAEGHSDRIGTFQGVSFTADNLKKTYEELKARGVEFLKPPTTEPWGEFCIFKDVDGNQFVMSGR